MSNHSFSLQNGETEILCELNCQLDWQPFGLEYELKINQEMVSSNRVQQSDIENVFQKKDKDQKKRSARLA